MRYIDCRGSRWFFAEECVVGLQELAVDWRSKNRRLIIFSQEGGII